MLWLSFSEVVPENNAQIVEEMLHGSEGAAHDSENDDNRENTMSLKGTLYSPCCGIQRFCMYGGVCYTEQLCNSTKCTEFPYSPLQSLKLGQS